MDNKKDTNICTCGHTEYLHRHGLSSYCGYTVGMTNRVVQFSVKGEPRTIGTRVRKRCSCKHYQPQ